MLDAGRPPQHFGALTLWHDHADARRRYVLPDAPRLALDALQRPQLSLLLFRGGPGSGSSGGESGFWSGGESGGSNEGSSGGLLQLEAALAPTAAQLAAAEHALVEQGLAQPDLVRPDWRSGSVRLAGWLAADELAPLSLFTGAPSLLGDPSTVVAARLDAAGAALAAAALRGDALPTVLMLELETLGLAGALGIEVEADLQALHDRLSAEGALTTPYGRARLAATWEQAARDNLIRVHVVDESGDVESRRAEAMRRVGEALVARMFSPLPPAEKPPLLDDGSVAPIELSFKLTLRREELETSTRWDFRERSAVPIRHHAAASLVDLLGSRPASEHIFFADLEAPAAPVVVRAEPELARLGIAGLDVELRETGSDTVLHTATLTDTQPQSSFEPASGAAPLQWRAHARFDPLVTQSPARSSDWQQAVGHLVAVSARRLFAPRSLTVIVGRGELDWIDHVELTLQAGDDPPRTLLLDAATPSAQAFLAAAGDETLRVGATWRGRGDEPSLTEPTREVAGEVLVLDSPFGESIDVLLVPLPPAGTRAMSVELRVRCEGFEQRRTVAWELPAREPQRIALRRPLGAPARFEYRVQRVGEDGTMVEGEWAETERTTLVVGFDGAADVRRVDVVLLGGGVVGRGALAVELAFECGDERSTELLEGAADTASLTLVVPQGAPPALLTAREFLDSGAVRETRWVDPPALLALPPVAESVP